MVLLNCAALFNKVKSVFPLSHHVLFFTITNNNQLKTIYKTILLCTKCKFKYGYHETTNAEDLNNHMRNDCEYDQH